MKRLAIAVACILLAACDVFPSRLKDLAFERVTFVPAGSPLHFQTPYPSDAAEGFFRLTVSSSQNLVAKSDAGELNIYPMIVECSRRERELIVFGPFLDEIDVSDGDHPKRAIFAAEKRTRFNYDLFIPVAGRVYVDDNQGGSYHPYDLVERPTEICVRIGGGNMLGGHFRSNELRLRINPPAEAQ